MICVGKEGELVLPRISCTYICSCNSLYLTDLLENPTSYGTYGFKVNSLVWACLCLKFYWMFYLEIKNTLVILWSVFMPLKLNNAMNNIYQLVLISCAILSLSSWLLIPLPFRNPKIPISETCLVPRVSDKRLCTCSYMKDKLQGMWKEAVVV
jgi:hypothetical protein